MLFRQESRRNVVPAFYRQLKHLCGNLILQLFVVGEIGGNSEAVGQRHDYAHHQCDAAAGPEGNNAERIAGDEPAGSHNAAHQHGPECGLLVHLLPERAHNQNQAGHSANLEGAVDLGQDGSGIQAQIGSAKTKNHDGNLGELQLLLGSGVLFDDAGVEVAGQGGADGEQESGSGGEHGGDDAHAGHGADEGAEGISNDVKDFGGVFHFGVHDLAVNADESGEESEDEHNQSTHQNALVGILLGTGTVNIGHQRGGQDEGEQAAQRIADYFTDGGLGYAQVAGAERLKDSVGAAGLDPGEDHNHQAADEQHAGVNHVHPGNALQTGQSLNDKHSCHDPGANLQINIEHGGEDSAGGLGLQGIQNAVHHNHDDHDHDAAALGAETELISLRNRVVAIVAGGAIQLADGQNEGNYAQALAPVGPDRGKTDLVILIFN